MGCDYTLTIRLVLVKMDLIDSELLMEDKRGGGYSRSMEIKRVGVSRLIGLNFTLIDFSYEFRLFCFIRLLGR